MTLLARRLSRGGTGGFTVPQPAVLNTAVNGSWNDINDPKAVTYNGKTYFVSVQDDGDIHCSSIDHATHAVVTSLVGSGFSSPSGNIHNSIALLVRSSDKRILIVECAEGSSSFFVNVSTNPESVASFGTAYQILTGGPGYTYVSLCELTAEGAIYLWTTMEDGATAKLSYSKSLDNGATWSAMTKVVSPTASTRTYRRIGHTASRIDIFTTNTDRSVANPSSVYHLYMTGGLFYKSDGTQITASQPFAASQGTLVQDTTYGRARPTGWGYDLAGNPAVVIHARDLAADTQPELVRVGRYTGSWTSYSVASSNVLMDSSGMVKNDPNVLYVPRGVSGILEMFRYVSTDAGATWTGTQLTSSSAENHASADTPLNPSAVRAIWGNGTYTGPGFNLTVIAYTT